MSDIQYEQYKNLHTFATDWRKYERKSAIMTREEFRKSMYSHQFVELKYNNPKNKRTVLIYLFSEQSKYEDKPENMRQILVKIKKYADIILILKNPPDTYLRKNAIQKFKNLKIKAYLQQNFNEVIPHASLCYPHRILSKHEAETVLNYDLCCYLNNLPKIPVSDVQCIWIGAEVGDIVEIKPTSYITGESVQYRLVVSNTGTVTSFRSEEKINENHTDETTNEEDIDEEDETIKEYHDESDIMEDHSSDESEEEL